MEERWMRRALELAALARGKTSPNPLVGAVVVKDGQEIGAGYHHRAGTPHAEVHALREAGDAARGATLYVTLEPCCHFGRTPPCTGAVIAAGIKQVVVATRDPNLLVSGKGISALHEAGIEVEEGLLEQEAQLLNEVFFKYIISKRPFVTLKTAISLDGKIATRTGDSQWITGEEARQEVQRLRAVSDSVLTGIGTVIADDPLLTVRLPGTDRQPLRIVVDSTLRLPLDSQLVRTAGEAPLLVATASGCYDPAKREQLAARGVEVWEHPADQGMVELPALLHMLGKQQVTSVLLECGGTLNASFIERGLVDKLIYFIAPLLIGGATAPGAIGGQGPAALADCLRLKLQDCQQIGTDLMITTYPDG